LMFSKVVGAEQNKSYQGYCWDFIEKQKKS
jgi:hypothetical protein